jgi:hypothetical protein
MKPFLALVLAAFALVACKSLGDVQDNRLDPGQPPHPSYPTR